MISKVLLVIKSPPYGNNRANEGLRIATAMIAMDVLPQIWFMEDGVYCLVKNQKVETVGLDSFTERLRTLADLVGLYAFADSLFQRKLQPRDLDENFKVKILAINETTELVAQNETVMTF